MTSKEALEEFLNDFLEKCKELNDNDDMYYKYNLTSPYHIIKKDLEILEFLKEYFQTNDCGQWYIDMQESDFDFRSECSKEEWEKSPQKK